MIFLTFSRAYPRQSILMVGALLLAGLAEGSSLSLMLPLISFAVDNESGVEPENQSEFTQWITGALETIGITPAIGNLLIIVVVFILLKNAMLLVANKQELAIQSIDQWEQLFPGSLYLGLSRTGRVNEEDCVHHPRTRKFHPKHLPRGATWILVLVGDS